MLREVTSNISMNASGIDPTSQPTMTRAFSGACEAQLASKLRCPHCMRLLRATDIDVDFGDVRLICRGCHRDILMIRAKA
jgi:hypothetical protein